MRRQNKPMVFSTRVEEPLGRWIELQARSRGVKRAVIVQEALRAYRAADDDRLAHRSVGVVQAIGETYGAMLDGVL